jgi:hypothetical protein
VLPFNGLAIGVVQSWPENKLNVTVPPGAATPFPPITVARSNADDPAGLVLSHTGPPGLGATCTSVIVDELAGDTVNGSQSLVESFVWPVIPL